MSHQITDADKVFTVFRPAWHGLDTNLQERLTFEQAQQFLGWEVGLVPAELHGRKSKRWFYTVRKDIYDPNALPVDDAEFPPGVLGMVGRGYTPIQNSELWKFFDPVVRDGEMIFESGGSLLGGAKVWLLARLPEYAYKVTANDWINLFVLTANSHDGTFRWLATYSQIRVECWNTMAAALSAVGLGMDWEGDPKEAPWPVVTIKHTRNAQFQLEQAHEVLGLATLHGKGMQVFFSKLADKFMSLTDLERFTKAVFPSSPEDLGKPAAHQTAEIRDLVKTRFEADINNLNPEKKYTGWTALNAVTEWIDHLRKPRKKDAEVEPLEFSWFGDGRKVRNRAIDWLARWLKLED